MAAAVAIAVPQMPIKWTRSLNGALLDHQTRPVIGHDPARGAERERHRRARRVAGRKADHDGALEITERVGHRCARARIAGRLVAAGQLADDDRRRLREKPALPKLRHHAMESIRTLGDFLEEQDVPRWRRKLERRPE